MHEIVTNSALTLPPGIIKLTAPIFGVNTSYYQSGEGGMEPLVLLHGMSASADTFRELMLALSRYYRVVAPDIPGFGDTADTRPYTFPHLIDWLRAFVGQVAGAPVHLIGHSFGGALAVSYAIASERDVRSLILLAPSVLRPGHYPEWLRGLAASPVAEWILGLGVSASRIMLQQRMRAAFYDPSQYGADFWMRQAYDYKRARASAAVLRASALHDIRAELPTISRRSCIIWGSQDPILAPEDAYRLNEMMPKSRTDLHILPRCGHVPHIEQQERVLGIINSFLQPGSAPDSMQATD